MLADFERLPSGQRGCIKGNIRVGDVVLAFQEKGSEWLRGVSEDGLSGSHLSKQVSILRCTANRPNSILRSAKELNEDGLEPKTALLTEMLMQVLVAAQILTGPDDKKRYHLGSELSTRAKFA